MNQSREAHLAADALHSPEGPLSWTDTSVTEPLGTRPLRVGIDVGLAALELAEQAATSHPRSSHRWRPPRCGGPAVTHSSQRGNGDRTQGRERQADRGGDFNDAPPF
jgi:hypothetical protein